MVLKVDHEELSNVTSTMKKDAEKTKTEIENMEKALERLRNIWEGQDSDAFCTNLENFLTKFKGIPTTLETISKVCDESNAGFKERDEEFGKALEAEAVANE